MSEFIVDTGRTAEEPLDYSWRNDPGAFGCLGTIDCEECGCIMAAQGSHCFCMGIYTCPRCGYEKTNVVYDNINIVQAGFMSDKMTKENEEIKEAKLIKTSDGKVLEQMTIPVLDEDGVYQKVWKEIE